MLDTESNWPAIGQPLQGIRILDLTQVLAGPYGSMLLADMGADVIKIERPPAGDPARQIPPLVAGESAYFWSINRNKRSVVLELAKPAGKAVFRDLAFHADVVLDNFRPGVMARLGLDYPRLGRVNPRLIACSISAFGPDGDYRLRPAYDLVVQAMSGIMSITGEPGRPPVRLGLPMGDLAGGIFAALAILAALFQRERTGRGQLVDVAMLDGLLGLLTYVASAYFASGSEPTPVGSAHHSLVPYQAFATADGYLVVAILAEKFWVRLCQALELEELVDDPRFSDNSRRLQNREVLIPILEKAFRRRSRAEWLAILEREDVPCGQVNTLGEALSDPHVQQRGMVIAMEHPTAGEIRQAGAVPKFPGGKGDGHRSPPLLGQHTEEVLREITGYSAEQIDELRLQGIIAT